MLSWWIFLRIEKKKQIIREAKQDGDDAGDVGVVVDGGGGEELPQQTTYNFSSK